MYIEKQYKSKEEEMDLFNNQWNSNLGSVGRTPTETSLYLEQGVYENDVYSFSLDEIGDLDISLYNLSSGDDADLQLYRDSNDNGYLDANDEFIDGSYNAGDADDSIRYDDAPVGNYFTHVNYFSGGDDGYIDYSLSLVSQEPSNENLFDFQFNYELGVVDRTTTERSTFLSQGVYENDVYRFSLSETSNIDLTLNSLDSTDDADLQLYQDTNDNGYLDANDQYIDGSYALAGSTDTIDYDAASAGTYFAHVDYYYGGDDGYIDYDLTLTADTEVNQENRFSYQSNLYLGDIGRTPTETNLYLEQGIYENDSYELTLLETGDLDISLYNLSTGDDADLSLYRDVNNNYILDGDDEFIDGSYNAGDTDDYIRYEDAPAGTYFANVNYYDGGADGFIDYSLSASAESENVDGGSNPQGDVIFGSDYDDILTGTDGNDTIQGHYGSDELIGGDGDDVLNGSHNSTDTYDYIINQDPSVYIENDILTGGEGADTFVLGGSSVMSGWGGAADTSFDYSYNLYEGYGYDDYATITDFNWIEGDKIQVHGVAEDYSISEYNYGVDIYHQGELIGHVENTTDVIISQDFTFV